MMLLPIVLKIHLACTLAMAGLIWTVQIVQYPLFAQVDAARFGSFHAGHVRRIGFVVGPLMMAEALSGVLLLSLLGAQRELRFLQACYFLPSPGEPRGSYRFPSTRV